MKLLISLIMLTATVVFSLDDLADQSEKRRAYLGVYAVELSAALQSHLKLDRGLIVESVVKKSPAAEAGIKKYDIILNVNDTKVNADGTLSELIHKYKPEDIVKLEIMRAGETQALKVKLGEALPLMLTNQIKEKILIDPDDFKNDNISLIPGSKLEEIRKRMEELQQLKVQTIDEDLQRILERIANGPQGPNNFQFSGSSSSVINMNDGKHNIVIKIEDAKKHVKVTDSSGKVIFDGHINSDEDMKKLPEDVREKINNIQTMNLP